MNQSGFQNINDGLTLKKIILSVWLGLVLLATIYLFNAFQITTDITQFLPDAATKTEKLAIEQIQQGFSQKIIMLSITGKPQEKLADISQQFVEAMKKYPFIQQVTNGALSDLSTEMISALQKDMLFQYRYLLDPQLNSQTFQASSLAQAFEQAVIDIASPVGHELLLLLKADPTQQFVNLLERMNPLSMQTEQGVWFSKDHQQALVLIVTKAPGFDTDQQALVLKTIVNTFAKIDAQVSVKMTGPGVISVKMRQQITQEATVLSITAMIAIIIMLWIGLGHLKSLLLTTLPLISGIIIAISTVLLFDNFIHGLTLAFGITLLGIAVDYPIHVLAHINHTSSKNTKAILWRTLLYSFISTILAFSTLLLTNFSGLRQLGIFIISGLFAAYLVTRFVLPLLHSTEIRFSFQAIIRKITHFQGCLPWLGYPIIFISVIFFSLYPNNYWNDSLSAMQPINKTLLATDKMVRDEFSMPHVQSLLLVESTSLQDVLERLEDIQTDLEHLKAKSMLQDYDLASTWLPSIKTQNARQALLPDTAEMQQEIKMAVKDTPFSLNFFQSFIDDVQQSKLLPFITTTQQITSEVWQNRIANLISFDGKNWHAKIPLIGISNDAAFYAITEKCPTQCHFLPLKSISESLLQHYREQLLFYSAIGLILLSLLILFFSASIQQGLRILLNLSAAILLTILTLFILKGALNIIHILGMMLVLGLGLDYAFFFSKQTSDNVAKNQTVYSLLICLLSTITVFGLLSQASAQVLLNLGQTVFIGTLITFTMLYFGIKPATR